MVTFHFSGCRGRQLGQQHPADFPPEAALLRGPEVAGGRAPNLRRPEVAVPRDPGAPLVRPSDQQGHHHPGQLGHRKDQHHPTVGPEQLLWAER